MGLWGIWALFRGNQTGYSENALYLHPWGQTHTSGSLQTSSQTHCWTKKKNAGQRKFQCLSHWPALSGKGSGKYYILPRQGKEKYQRTCASKWPKPSKNKEMLGRPGWLLPFSPQGDSQTWGWDGWVPARHAEGEEQTSAWRSRRSASSACFQLSCSTERGRERTLPLWWPGLFTKMKK